MSEIVLHFSSRLRKLRGAHNLTQKELSEALNISLRNLQNIEHGKADPCLSLVKKVTDFFDISISSFFEKKTLCPSTLTYLDFLSVGIQVSSKEGLVLYQNNACYRFTGYTRAETCNKMYLWDFIEDKKEKEDIKVYLNYLLDYQPRPTPYISTTLTKNGERIRFYDNWNYIYDNQKNVIGFISNITRL